MGLDLYVGTLARYHTGAWETEVQRVGRETGVRVTTVYADGRPKRLPTLIAPLSILLWRRRTAQRIARSTMHLPSWSEARTQPYLARKPDHVGQRALVLASAHAEQPQFARPHDLPATNESDPAYAAVSAGYLQSRISVLECHMFLPSAENFLIVAPDPVGVERFITSTGNLAAALDFVNRTLWQADEAQIAAWSRRGAATDTVLVMRDGALVPEAAEPPVDGTFTQNAQFGFAVYAEALNFSRRHNLPILTDE